VLNYEKSVATESTEYKFQQIQTNLKTLIFRIQPDQRNHTDVRRKTTSFLCDAQERDQGT
jgi:hypothetical protein